MQNVTQKYQEAIQSYDRKFLIKAVFCQPIVGAVPDETGQRPVQEVAVLTGADNLVSMTLEEAAAADDHISMGSFCSTKLTAELIDAPKNIDYDNVMIKAYSGLLIEDETYEYVPLGTFYITEVSTKNDYKNLTLTAYDGACLLEEPFSIDEGYPMSIEELVRQIAAGKEFSLHPDNEYKEYLLPTFKEGYTCRQMLGFAAGLMGCNVKFDRLGRLQFYWYQEPALQTTIDRQNQYLHEFIPSTVSPVTVTSLICSDGEKTYTRGKGTSGLELTFENPYMTETIMETIWQERVADMDTAETITTLQVSYSGEPDTEHILTGTYNQSLSAFRCTDLSKVHPGTLMEMTYELEQIPYSRNIMVESIDEEKSQFTFTLEETDEDQEELNLPEDLTARFTITRQWLVIGGNLALIEKNDLLKVSNQGIVNVSMIDREAGELYLTDTSKDPIYGMAGGTEMTLIKQKVNDYRICYLPGELKWRGNPALEAGDIVMAEKADGSCENFYIMTQNLRLSGGLSSQLAAKGENETSANFSSAGDGPTDKKLTRVYTSLQETILKATNRITGQSGGHVVINENDSGPAEILIMDTDDIRTAKKVWRWNQGGLGYSSNGYNGPYGTAVTQDGEIVGSYIQAESIAGSKLKIDSQVIEKIVAGINAGEQKINSASLDIDSEDISEAIKMQVSQSGGTNKICNSVGAYDLQGWICSGDVQRLNGEDQKINLISGRAFSLSTGATLESDLSVAPVRLTAGLSYTLSAVIKHNDCYGSLQLISGSGMILAQIDAGGSGEGWQKYEISFAVTESDIAGLFTIKLTSENGSFVVGDLLLNEGSQTTWSAYPGEVDSTTLTMSQFGITIRQENAQTKTVIDSAGTRVINIENEDTDQTEDVAAEYTKDGVEAKSLIAREQIAAGRVRMISLSDKQMAAWIINSDSEVDL